MSTSRAPRPGPAPAPGGPPSVLGVHETVLYAPDLDAATEFYTRGLGLRLVSDSRPRGVALRVSAAQVLLLFNPALTRAPNPQVPSPLVPSHGADGPGHVALRVWRADLDAWEQHLRRAGVGVERWVDWPLGGRSLYVRDPAGNSVELVAGEVWAG